MGRKRIDINPIPGIRLAEILDDKKISQKELSNRINISQQSISKMVNGAASVTDATADLVIKQFPEYNKSWLMGYSDVKISPSPNEAMNNLFRMLYHETKLLHEGFRAFAELNHFYISFKEPDRDTPIERKVQEVAGNYIISKDDKSVELTMEEMNDLQNEISDYVEFKLNRLINMQKYRQKTSITINAPESDTEE